MANVGYVKAIFDANTAKLEKGVKRADRSLSKFGKAAGRVTSILKSRTTLAFAAIGAASAKMASDFESSMVKIETLVGRSAAEVERMERAVKQLAGETARAPNELAEAMFFITSAGLEGAAATDVLTASAKASAIGLGDTATIADLATSALNAYGAENLSAVKATDILTAAVREGKLQSDELAGSMGRVLPIASAMGVGFDEVGAAFAALSRTGTNASEAATQLRGILASILRPTKQSEEAMAGLGLSAAGLRQQIKEEGLLSVLKTLAETFDGQSDAAALVFGNIRALMGVMDLLGKNSGTTEEIFSRMADTTGMVDQAFARVTETSGFKLNQAMTDLKLSMIEIGEQVLPVVVPMLEKAADVLQIFFGNSQVAEETLQLLREEMTEAGTASVILTTDIDTLVESMRDFAGLNDAALPVLEAFNAEMTAMNGMSVETRRGFQALGGDFSRHNDAIESGSDVYRQFTDEMKATDNTTADLMRALNEVPGAFGDQEDAILAAVRAGEMSADQVKEMALSLNSASRAQRDHTKEMEETAEAFFLDERAVQAYRAVLSDTMQATIDQRVADGDLVSALELVITAYAGVETAAEVAGTSLSTLTGLIPGHTAAVTEMATAVEMSTYELEQMALATEDADRALLGWISSNSEAAMNTRFWEQEADGIAAVTAALEAAADLAASRNELAWDIEVRNMRKKIAQEERDAAAAVAQAERDRIANLRTVRDLEWQILGVRQQSLEQTKDATKNVISLLRADRQVRMTEKAINQLLDERNELLGLGVDDDAESIDQMKQQQEAISKVEEELLKMTGELVTADGVLEYLTEAQARSNDITGQQAQSLIEATRALYDATRAEAMGYGSKIDLIAAGERLAEVHDSIFTGAEDVADAQDRLREIDESLITASEQLALDELAVNDAQRLVAESGDLAYAAAESLSTMFTAVLGPAAVGVSDNMNELARSLVEEADKVFPEFDAMRKALEGITFGMTADQIDGYVRSVTAMINAGQREVAAILASADPPTLEMILTRPSTAGIQAAINEMNRTFAVTGQITLPTPDTATMISDVQTALDGANLRVDVDVVMQTVDPSTAATLAWLQTEGAHNLLGIPWTAMASGGIVDSPTLALIGESGPEAVVPLGRSGMGGGTTVNVNVAGSILTESEIGEIVQEQLLRIQARNQTLEFA